MKDKVKQLVIERPDESVILKCSIRTLQPRITIGKLIVEDGRLLLVCCAGDDIDGPGSLIPPLGTIIGDLNFSLK